MHSALTALTAKEREQVATALSRALDEIVEVVRPHLSSRTD